MLLYCIRTNEIEVVESLLKASYTDVNEMFEPTPALETESATQTALHYAAKLGRLIIVKLLMQHPQIDASVKDFDGNTALDLAENNMRKMQKIIEEIKRELDTREITKDTANYKTKYFISCSNEYIAIIQILKKHMAKENTDQYHKSNETQETKPSAILEPISTIYLRTTRIENDCDNKKATSQKLKLE